MTRDTLASNQERLVDDDGVGELCTLCITGHNNGLYSALHIKNREKEIIGKNGVWKPLSTRDRLNVFSWFSCAFQWIEAFLNKHTNDMLHEFLVSFGRFWKKSACPLRRLWSFWSTDTFFQILLLGVAYVTDETKPRYTRPITAHKRTAICKNQLEAIIKKPGNKRGVGIIGRLSRDVFEPRTFTGSLCFCF